MTKYERLVYAIPLNYGLGRDEAADIAQRTFIILLESLDSVRDEARLGGWLATVARRQSWRTMARQRREHPIAEDDLAALPDLDDPASQQQERQELLEWIHMGLSRLNGRCRQLLLALYFEPTQPSYEEVAEQLNMRVGSIGPTRARCLVRLKERLDELA